ncbi:MAG: ABC transporter ATP-binding protein [Chloroflexi bacterium]|nr:MAG: ABC transporter ATP-binding protein [Chloroflexota bacterium]
MATIVLQTRDLTKRFGSVTAVNQVNLVVYAGEVFGFLGPNGAGKTTTIGMILGLIHPTAGQIEIFGQQVTPHHNAALRRVGALVGSPALIPYLSGRDNLRLLARLYPELPPQRVDEVLALVGLSEAADRKFKAYSTGMKQRLGLAAALLHKPALVVLDEPTNGLDPAGMREMRQFIRALADEGVTVFLSSHLLHEVEQVCDRVAVLNRGQIVTMGRVDELLKGSHEVVKVRVPEPKAAADVLAMLPDVTRVETNGRFVQVHGVSGEQVLSHLTHHGIVPGELRVERSDLEDLFLELTKS